MINRMNRPNIDLLKFPEWKERENETLAIYYTFNGYEFSRTDQR